MGGQSGGGQFLHRDAEVGDPGGGQLLAALDDPPSAHELGGGIDRLHRLARCRPGGPDGTGANLPAAMSPRTTISVRIRKAVRRFAGAVIVAIDRTRTREFPVAAAAGRKIAEAACFACSSAFGTLSSRMVRLCSGNGRRVQSPMAKMRGSDVAAFRSTQMPPSQARPASKASSSFGTPPTPISAASHGISLPSARRTPVTAPCAPSRAWISAPSSIVTPCDR